MHIAIDARVINSGTGTYVVRLLEYLQQIDHENQYSVLIPSKDIDYWKPSAKNFTVCAIDYKNYSFSEQLGYLRFLNKLKPDLVHFCMPQQPVFYKGNKVTTMHDMTLLSTYNSDKNWIVFHIKQLIGRWVWRRIAKTNHHIIAISENTKRGYQEFTRIPDGKISVIYEAGETPSATREPYALPFDSYITYVGQQPDYKNLRRLATAHQRLLKKYPDLGLVFVGRTNTDTIRNKEFYEKNGYRNIHFTGYISDPQRNWVISHADAYVFPSLMEGFGLPPLEAMALGTPVVSSSTSCLPEILGEAAYYFNPYEVSDITRAIDQVLGDMKLRDTLISRGYLQIKKYSWENMAQQTHSIYMRALRDER